MTRHRSFTSARAEAKADPITFDVDGEVFTVAGLEAGPVLDLVAALPDGIDVENASLTDAGRMFPALRAFLDEIVVEEDQERWRKTMRHVTPETFINLVAFVIEEATGRPLASASPSPGSPSEPSTASPGPSPDTGGETPST